MPDLGTLLLPLVAIAVAFVWAFVRAVRRSASPPRTSGAAASPSAISEEALARLDRRVAIETSQEEGRLTQDQYDRLVAAWEDERLETDQSAVR